MEFQLPTGGMDEFAEWPAQVSGHFPFGFDGMPGFSISSLLASAEPLGNEEHQRQEPISQSEDASQSPSLGQVIPGHPLLPAVPIPPNQLGTPTLAELQMFFGLNGLEKGK